MTSAPIALCPSCLESIAEAGYTVTLTPPRRRTAPRVMPPEEVTELVTEWLSEMTIEAPGAKETRARIHGSFDAWCRLVRHISTPSRQALYAALDELGYQQVTVRGHRYYRDFLAQKRSAGPSASPADDFFAELESLTADETATLDPAAEVSPRPQGPQEVS